MKIDVGTFTKEGAITSYGACINGGLMIRTDGNYVFEGKTRRLAAKQKFLDFINQLEALGVTVTGKEKIQ